MQLSETFIKFSS